MTTADRSERGIALILVLIFSILLYVLVTELVVTARSARSTGENDALLARMQNHMVYTLGQVEEQLEDDLLASSAGDGAAAGGIPGLGGLASAGGLPDEAGGAAAEEGNDADSSQDPWYEPTGYSDDDLTTYAWVEDENRKFNILAMVSPDRDFADESRQRFVRLIDYLREGTQLDLSPSHGEEMATAIIEWLKGLNRTEAIPRPLLKSDGERFESEITVPLHLDELMMLPGISADLFFDQVLDGRVIQGLESVLTVYTSLQFDPGKPDPNAPLPEEPPPDAGGDGASPEGEQPQGVGIRININTATPPVLRCLFPPAEVPESVIDAILRYRNEEVEEDPDAEGTGGIDDYLGDMALGTTVKHKIFTGIEDLEELPEFANLPDPEIKQKFADLTTVQSDVFSVHMASVFKRNEERRIFVLRRARSILVRLSDREDDVLHPLILLEERQGMRVMPSDFPDDFNDLDFYSSMDQLDDFAQEERRWNPFFVDFYRVDLNR